jgi:hypothetical protein
MDHRFKSQGRNMLLSSEQVIQALKDVAPGQIRVHAVEINGVDYPVNQALAAATGLDPLEVNTGVARTKLKKLGFTVKRVG